MKMKKLMVLTALLAATTSAQAAVVQWLGNGNTAWTNSANWTPAVVPGSNDHVIVNNDTGPATIDSDVGNVLYLTPAWNAGMGGTLNILDGGSLAVTTAGGFTRLGYLVDAKGTLNMSGGYLVSGVLHLGFNSVAQNAGGSGVVNLSGNAVLHCGNLGWGQAFPDYAPGTDQDGTGEVHITGNARFLVNGDCTTSNWVANGWIDAYGVAGKSIVATYVASNSWTEFTATPSSSYVFYDSFDTGDTNNANVDVYSRQASGFLAASYSGFPQHYNITNNTLQQYYPIAWLNQGVDMASYIVGEDFELSCKVAYKADNGWSAFYLYDGVGDDRSESNLGMHITHTNDPWSCIVYYGVAGHQELTIDANWFPALAPYDKAQEHTFQFVSTAGSGETNSFDLFIDGVEITDGVTEMGAGGSIIPDSLSYYFDGPERRIGLLGVMSEDETTGAYYDDIYLKVFPRPTYEKWASDNGLVGADALRTADIENGGVGDGMENLLEYVLVGDPNVDDADSILPVLRFPDAATVEYIYRRRNDATARGLEYALKTKGDLVTDPWATGGTSETGTNAAHAEFDVITNSADITSTPELFLNLEVTEN